MSGYSGANSIWRYLTVQKDFDLNSVDDVRVYKNSINSPYIIIKRCLDAYDHNFYKAYSLVPSSEKARLAHEYRIKLEKREDLKSPYFDEKAVLDVIDDMHRRINSIPSSATGRERAQQKIIIEYECSQEIIKLKFMFKEKDIERILGFWANQ